MQFPWNFKVESKFIVLGYYCCLKVYKVFVNVTEINKNVSLTIRAKASFL
jgi:hypothetical protein